MNKIEIATMVKESRISKGIDEESIIQALGIDQRLFSQYENAEAMIPDSLLKKWADILSIPYEDLNLEEDVDFDPPKFVTGLIMYPPHARKITFKDIFGGFKASIKEKGKQKSLEILENHLFHPDRLQNQTPKLYIFTFVTLFIVFWAASLIGDIVLTNLSLSMIVPLSLLVLMLELHYPKNVKGISLLSYYALGGIFSIFTVFLVRSYTGYVDVPFLGDLLTAFVEELSKIFIVLIILSRMRVKHVMTGILIGFAVGAGFNAFENSQYGVVTFFEEFDLNAMYDTLFIRSIYDLFGIGHHFWTAILGGTLVMVSSTTSIRVKALFHPLFLQTFVLVMLIHACFNFSSYVSIWLTIVIVVISLVIFIRFYSIAYRRYYLNDTLPKE